MEPSVHYHYLSLPHEADEDLSSCSASCVTEREFYYESSKYKV